MAELNSERGGALAALAIDDYTGTPEELLKRAWQIVEPQVTDFCEVPALLLAAVNKRLEEIAPDEEPHAAVKRLTAEWDKWSIEGAYEPLTWYYEDSLNPKRFIVSYERIDHEDYIGVARDTFRMLKNDNG